MKRRWFRIIIQVVLVDHDGCETIESEAMKVDIAATNQPGPVKP